MLVQGKFSRALEKQNQMTSEKQYKEEKQYSYLFVFLRIRGRCSVTRVARCVIIDLINQLFPENNLPWKSLLDRWKLFLNDYNDAPHAVHYDTSGSVLLTK